MTEDKPMIFPWPGQEGLALRLQASLSGEAGRFEWRRFPDGESYLRILSELKDRTAILCASLDRPDDKLAPLLWWAATARELGAKKLVLVAPYLAYLRQDARFQEGEGVTSRYFAKLLSTHFDALLTVDPHLHRYRTLDEIYTIPSRVLTAAPEIAIWVRGEIERPVFLGPDAESDQWVSRVAALSGAPYAVAEKRRLGDRQVELRLPQVEAWSGFTPVLVDDIISTGVTMLETLRQLKAAGWPAPVCVGVHAIFAGRAYEDLSAAGAAAIVTCNTVPHPSNRIDISESLSTALSEIL
ncbi:MAG: ribose-phosphate pyrophosphokinase [Deltaproteobacteria bacterium]|nr:ribose-phosphate pyrophosphokinase [Deltaproteobacteria bacterium]